MKFIWPVNQPTNKQTENKNKQTEENHKFDSKTNTHQLKVADMCP